MSNPKVSIGMAVYNGGFYLKDTLNSILSQTFTDYELIISDNASLDNTMKICKMFEKNDSRIRYYRNKMNLGAAWNLNHVFHLGKGKYFQWACHDDIWTSTLLQRYVEVLDENQDVVLCYGRTTYINEMGTPLRSLIRRPLLQDAIPSIRFRKFMDYHPNECNPVLGLFRSNILGKTRLIGSYPSSDMILLGEIALAGRFFEIPDCLFLRRDHPESSVRSNPGWEDRAVWFNPLNKGKLQLHAFKWTIEWMKSICRSPIGVLERLKCVFILCLWAKKNKNEFKQDLKKVVKKYVYSDNY